MRIMTKVRSVPYLPLPRQQLMDSELGTLFFLSKAVSCESLSIKCNISESKFSYKRCPNLKDHDEWALKGKENLCAWHLVYYPISLQLGSLALCGPLIETEIYGNYAES